MKVNPATVIVPIRGLPVSFAVIVYVTIPLPLPRLPEVMVIQEALLATVQPQPAGNVTAILPLAAPCAKAALIGEICAAG